MAQYRRTEPLPMRLPSPVPICLASRPTTQAGRTPVGGNVQQRQRAMHATPFAALSLAPGANPHAIPLGWRPCHAQPTWWPAFGKPPKEGGGGSTRARIGRRVALDTLWRFRRGGQPAAGPGSHYSLLDQSDDNEEQPNDTAYNDLLRMPLGQFDSASDSGTLSPSIDTPSPASLRHGDQSPASPYLPDSFGEGFVNTRQRTIGRLPTDADADSNIEREFQDMLPTDRVFDANRSTTDAKYPHPASPHPASPHVNLDEWNRAVLEPRPDIEPLPEIDLSEWKAPPLDMPALSEQLPLNPHVGSRQRAQQPQPQPQPPWRDIGQGSFVPLAPGQKRRLIKRAKVAEPASAPRARVKKAKAVPAALQAQRRWVDLGQGSFMPRLPGQANRMMKRAKVTSAYAALAHARRLAADQTQAWWYEREVKQNEPYLEVRQSTLPQLGRGLFALKDFRKGEALSEYRGRLRSRNELDRLYGPDDVSVATYAIELRQPPDPTNSVVNLLRNSDRVRRVRNKINRKRGKRGPARQRAAREEKKMESDLERAMDPHNVRSFVDPSQDPREAKYYTPAQFANDCLASTSRYMKDIAKVKPCGANNAVFMETSGHVFLVADRDIKAGDEIFVGYGSKYWGPERVRIFQALYDYLANRYRENPRRTFTAAELLVDVWPRLELIWGTRKRIRSLEKISYALRTHLDLIYRTPTEIDPTPQQWDKYLRVRTAPYYAYSRRPKRRKTKPDYQYRLRNPPFERPPQ